MNAITYTAARENLASTMDQVCNDRNPVIITRKREQAVVMISLEDYEALEETAYLLRSPANAKRLITSIEAAEQGAVVAKNIDLSEWTSPSRRRLGKTIFIGRKRTSERSNESTR